MLSRKYLSTSLRSSHAYNHSTHRVQGSDLKALTELHAAVDAKASEAAQQLAAASRRLEDLEGTVVPGLQVRASSA